MFFRYAVRVTGLPSDGNELTLHYPKAIAKNTKDIELGTRKYTVRQSFRVESVVLNQKVASGRGGSRGTPSMKFPLPLSTLPGRGTGGRRRA